MRAEYDFDYSQAIRGKHAKRIREEGTNIVLLEPDIADYFKDSAVVNEVLRQVIAISNLTERKKLPAKKRKATKPVTKVARPAVVQNK